MQPWSILACPGHVQKKKTDEYEYTTSTTYCEQDVLFQLRLCSYRPFRTKDELQRQDERRASYCGDGVIGCFNVSTDCALKALKVLDLRRTV
jgi:hypothetical protein